MLLYAPTGTPEPEPAAVDPKQIATLRHWLPASVFKAYCTLNREFSTVLLPLYRDSVTTLHCGAGDILPAAAWDTFANATGLRVLGGLSAT